VCCDEVWEAGQRVWDVGGPGAAAQQMPQAQRGEREARTHAQGQRACTTYRLCAAAHVSF